MKSQNRVTKPNRKEEPNMKLDKPVLYSTIYNIIAIILIIIINLLLKLQLTELTTLRLNWIKLFIILGQLLAISIIIEKIIIINKKGNK